MSSENPYSVFFMTSFNLFVRANLLLQNMKKKVVLTLRGYNHPTEADQEGLKKIVALIPTAGQYDTGMPNRLRSRALLKGFRNLNEYADSLKDSPDELKDLKMNLTYVGSHFFRGTVWPRLEQACREAFAEKEQISVWCAGCANGKEAYSALMMLLDVVPAEKVSLLATDYNDEGLAQCAAGNYSLRTIDEIPQKYWRWIQRYKREASGRKDVSYLAQFQFKEPLRKLIHTGHQNLLTDEYPAGRDLVLCRNVIKFFEPDTRNAVQRKLAASLNVGGLLVLSESKDEVITDPGAMGLERLEDTCIYRRVR